MLNVGTDKNGIGYGPKWTNITGFSENVFSFIRELKTIGLYARRIALASNAKKARTRFFTPSAGLCFVRIIWTFLITRAEPADIPVGTVKMPADSNPPPPALLKRFVEPNKICQKNKMKRLYNGTGWIDYGPPRGSDAADKIRKAHDETSPENQTDGYGDERCAPRWTPSRRGWNGVVTFPVRHFVTPRM